MTDKRWEFELDGARHTVELEHNTFSNKQSVRVDGKLLSFPPESEQSKERNSRHSFWMEKHTCEIVINYKDRKYTYDFLLDGEPSVPEKYALEFSEAVIDTKSNATHKMIIHLFLWMGLGFSIISWVMALTLGYYMEFLALVGPMLAFIGVYFLAFPSDFVQQYSGKFSLRIWIALAIAFSLGFANNYVLSHGLY